MQEKLRELMCHSINVLGAEDEITVAISQRLDVEIVKSMKEMESVKYGINDIK